MMHRRQENKKKIIIRTFNQIIKLSGLIFSLISIGPFFNFKQSFITSIFPNNFVKSTT